MSASAPKHLAPEVLGALADGELGGFARLRARHHLARCSSCAAQLEALVRQSRVLRTAVPRHAAPAALRARLLALADQAPDEGPRDAPRTLPRTAPARAPVSAPRWRWIAGGAFAGSAATLATVYVAAGIMAAAGGDTLADEAVREHVQATLGNRLIEVASSDQHTVKPWLSARLDYSPPVRDLADAGFPLAGGRLDKLDGQTVATLVYHRHLHTIDVFVRPEPARAPRAARSLRGFNVAHAAAGGMDYLAVSDLNAQELQGFVDRLAEAR